VKRIAGVCVAALVAAVSLSARSADLSDQDRSELRDRAHEYQSQRARDPEFRPGAGSLNPEPAPTHAKRSKHSAKSQKRAAAPKAKENEPLSKKAARKARSLKNIPGAFVHGH
jgi:hypothetical protein